MKLAPLPLFPFLPLAAVAVLFAAGAADPIQHHIAIPLPTDTPIAALATPPLSVDSAAAVGVCADDDLWAARSVPMPLAHDVVVCGRTPDVAPSSGFALIVDGALLPVSLPSGPAPAPGSMVVISGRYHRGSSGAEWIDHTTRLPDTTFTPIGGTTITTGK